MSFNQLLVRRLSSSVTNGWKTAHPAGYLMACCMSSPSPSQQWMTQSYHCKTELQHSHSNHPFFSKGDKNCCSAADTSCLFDWLRSTEQCTQYVASNGKVTVSDWKWSGRTFAIHSSICPDRNWWKPIKKKNWSRTEGPWAEIYNWLVLNMM